MKTINRGFTLIEILVAVGIIAVMAAVTLGAMSGSREKSRDTQRVSDLGQIQLALKLSLNKNGRYPDRPDPVDISADSALRAELMLHIPSIPEAPNGGVYYYDSAYECGGRVVPVIYTTMESSQRGNHLEVCGTSAVVPREEHFAAAQEVYEFTGGGDGGGGGDTNQWEGGDGGLFILTSGCTSSWADNYDSSAATDDGSCYRNGCTSSWADNYDSNATINDGSCYRNGCTSSWADNYDPQATVGDGSCYKNGCTINWANNYDPQATINDGSCILPGCIDSRANNYNAAANTDDGTCVLSGCMDSNASNYESWAFLDDGSCTYGTFSAGSDDGTTGRYIIILQ